MNSRSAVSVGPTIEKRTRVSKAAPRTELLSGNLLRNLRDLRRQSPEFTRLRAAILRWYDRHKRDLPWRRRANDPYAQWVAEIMLQQTQVDTVVPYYMRFLARFPNIQALAAARHETVLKLWEGLGYYRRALHLHMAAGIVARRGGIMPRDSRELRELPGIGEYTAAAISSIAFGEKVAAVDGNVTRVVSRIFGLGAKPSEPRALACADAPSDPSRDRKRVVSSGDKAAKSQSRNVNRGGETGGTIKQQVYAFANRLISPSRPGDFNQALMDLGSSICTPRNPACSQCPIRSHCVAFQTGQVDSIPGTTVKAKPLGVTLATFAVVRGNELLMLRRPRGGLWSGLWELPTWPLNETDDRNRNQSEPRALARADSPPRLNRDRMDAGKAKQDGNRYHDGSEAEIFRRFSLASTDRLEFAGSVAHQLTHRALLFRVFRLCVQRPGQYEEMFGTMNGEGREMRWVTPEKLAALPISTAHRKIIALVSDIRLSEPRP